MLRNAFEPWHLILIIAVLVLLFGSKKLPDMARGLGRSMRILTSEARALQDDKRTETRTAEAPGQEAGTPRQEAAARH
ncbi:Sec-independent protein translocase subunit TatA [Streptomyces platensis]|uniref:Sec-independent protein translocase subunit TatA n=1 Tax=Streptomyces platensis TaxID=58346 RepID=UPI002E0E0977|nr:Sec-independent protein translocase subunit TatA [Streptomyces platensis]WSI56237.1 Sec-independent protein translocase subunit TatA [Streptomyces platensis]WUB80645.1 Sec-independent protein translocase subunit TatA [Streptomyces platensis]